MNKFTNIINSNNPDKYMEYFWLLFKTICSYNINRKTRIEIESKSEILNEYQKSEDYIKIFEEIHNFINTNINIIIGDMIMNGKNVDLENLLRCIKLWKEIDTTFTPASLEFEILKIVKSINIDKIKISVNKYLSTKKYDDLMVLFENAIEENHVFLIDILKKYIDIYAYLDFKEKNIVINNNGIDLIQFLKS